MTDIPRLPDEIRAALPLEAQVYLTALEAVVSELRVELDLLHQQNCELLARTRQTSRNSSRPPSSDPPLAPARPARPASPRKRGAQPGHKQHRRIMLPVEEVDEVIEHRPMECPTCHAALAPDLPDIAEPARQQVWEIPDIKPHVAEHCYHQVDCPCCHTSVEAERPAGVPSGPFGPGVVALVGLLHGRYRLSVREVVALRAEPFG